MITQATLDDAVRRIVDAVHPRSVVLFGSVARGEADERSDLDLLIVIGSEAERRDIHSRLHRCMRGSGAAADFVVATEADLRAYGEEPSLVYYHALREGREIYRAA